MKVNLREIKKMKKIFFAGFACMTILLCGCEKETRHGYNRFALNEDSKILWKGSLRNGDFNEGVLDIKGGHFGMENNKISEASFIIPVSSIINTNLPSQELKNELVDHLKGLDFFNMVVHPNITYKLISATASYPYGPSGTNYLISGELTVLGITKTMDIPATVNIHQNKINIKADFKINRTDFGMSYKTANELNDAEWISPEVSLAFDLTAQRAIID